MKAHGFDPMSRYGVSGYESTIHLNLNPKP